MVDLFARLAKPRLMELLRLKGVRHVFDPAMGRASGKFLEEGCEISLDKLRKTTQPYRDIERFVSDGRVMNFIIDPGLVPIVKSILLDVRGRQVLVTRKVGPDGAAIEGAVAHLDGFGMRIVLRFDPDKGESEVTWECLYGVG